MTPYELLYWFFYGLKALPYFWYYAVFVLLFVLVLFSHDPSARKV